MKSKTILGAAILAVAGSVGIYNYTQSDSEPITDNGKKIGIDTTNVPQKSKTDHFLVISDPHLHKGYSQAQVGKGVPDTGEDLWKITMEQFKKMANGSAAYPKPKFIVLLGDLPWHANPTDPGQLKVARASTGIVLKDLREAAQAANIPLIYSTGNNDSWSGDYRAFTAPNGEIPFDQDSSGIKDWPVINSGVCSTGKGLACIANDSLIDFGCYSVYPLGKNGGLKMIVLNTVMFAQDQDAEFAWHYYGPKGTQASDTKAQMDWFKRQLNQAKADEAIMIGVHIPPGRDAYQAVPGQVNEMWDPNLMYDGKPIKTAFLDIVGQYQDQIIGMLTSHTHMDGLRKMMYNKNGNLEFSDLIVSIPGITPGHGNNPGMKLISYDSQNFEWHNFTTVYNDFHATGTVSSQWGNEAFSFDNNFGAKKDSYMRDWVAQMDSTKLLQSIESIYTAMGNPLGSKNNVSLTLEVRP